jgi:DNA-binding response OmpR family regulator
MPRLSGLLASKELRRLGYKGIIIGVTGNFQSEDIEVFKGHGADAVLGKPISMKEFDDLVSTFSRSSS